MKAIKRLITMLLAFAVMFTVTAASLTASAAGIAAQMLNANQRRFYNEMVKRYVTEFSYGSSTSLQLIGKQDFNFDESEKEVTTEDLFVALAAFVSDYRANLPWFDEAGKMTEEYPVPFLAAVINLKDSLPTLEDDIFMVVSMLSVKEEYAGNKADMFGYPNITVKKQAVNSNTENLAFGAAVTVDSTAQQDGVDRADLAKELATDGDYTTRWQSNAAPSAQSPNIITLDFGKKVKLDRLRIYWETARANTDGYKVEFSNDGTAWETVSESSRKRIDKQIMSGKETYFDSILFNSTVNARYIRLNITAGIKGGASVYELEAYFGEPKAVKTLKKIELVFEGTANKSYYKGVFAVPDLAKDGIELKLIYSDNSEEIIKGDELKALQGFGSIDKVAACVDEATSSIAVQYKGLEASCPVTLKESPVTAISVTKRPTGTGLQGSEITTDTNEKVSVAADAVPAFSIDMMGVVLVAYEVESSYGRSMLASLTTPANGEENEEAKTTVMFMGKSIGLNGELVPDFTPTVSTDTSSEETESSENGSETESHVTGGQTSAPDSPSESVGGNGNDSSALIIVTVIVAIVLIGGGVAFIVIKKKK